MMNDRSRSFRLRLILAVLGSVVILTLGFLLDGGQTLSWAAPQQYPQLQTVPPRPTITPGIPPNPTRKPPLPEPPAGPPPHIPPHGGRDGDDGNKPPPQDRFSERDDRFDNQITSEDDQDSAQFMTIIERPSTGSVPSKIIVATATGSGSVREVSVRSYEAGSPYWLYALILGIVLILIGLFLVDRT